MHANHRGVAVKGEWTGLVTRGSAAVWNAPYNYPSGTFCFTCSMSDFWFEGVPLEWLAEALDVIEATPRVIYMILSKRPALATRRLAMLKRRLPANVWAGATIGHPQSLPLLKPLLRIEAPVHFLSVEPLLAPMVPGLDLTGIDWVIGGGESGPGARPCLADLMRAVRDLCVSTSTAFFLKQWGIAGNNPTPWAEELGPDAKGGATLDGRLWREFPIKNE